MTLIDRGRSAARGEQSAPGPRSRSYRGVPFTWWLHRFGRLAVGARVFEQSAASSTTALPDGEASVLPARRDAPAPPAGQAPVGAPRSFVLVHGLGVSSRYFLPLALELRRHGRVIAVDLPGHGHSPTPRGRVTIADHAGALARLLEAEGVHDPVLVGHSMGAQVVSRLAADDPGCTRRLVLLSPTIDPRRRRLAVQAVRLAADSFQEGLRANWTVFSDYWFRAGLVYYLRQLPRFFEDRIEERLPRITAATLVVRGTDDTLAGAAWAAQMARLLPRGRVREVPGPHVIMFSAPGELAELIAAHAR